MTCGNHNDAILLSSIICKRYDTINNEIIFLKYFLKLFKYLYLKCFVFTLFLYPSCRSRDTSIMCQLSVLYRLRWHCYTETLISVNALRERDFPNSRNDTSVVSNSAMRLVHRCSNSINRGIFNHRTPCNMHIVSTHIK